MERERVRVGQTPNNNQNGQIGVDEYFIFIDRLIPGKLFVLFEQQLFEKVGSSPPLQRADTRSWPSSTSSNYSFRGSDHKMLVAVSKPAEQPQN